MTHFVTSGTYVLRWTLPAFPMATGKRMISRILPLLLDLRRRHHHHHHSPVFCRTSITTSVIMRLHPRIMLVGLNDLSPSYVFISDISLQHRPPLPVIGRPRLTTGFKRRSGFTYANSS